MYIISKAVHPLILFIVHSEGFHRTHSTHSVYVYLTVVPLLPQHTVCMWSHYCLCTQCVCGPTTASAHDESTKGQGLQVLENYLEHSPYAIPHYKSQFTFYMYTHTQSTTASMLAAVETILFWNQICLTEVSN